MDKRLTCLSCHFTTLFVCVFDPWVASVPLTSIDDVALTIYSSWRLLGPTSTVHLCQFALSSLVFRFNCSRSHEIHLDVNADEFLMSRWCALNADLSSTPWLVNSMFEFKFFWNAQMYFSKLYAFDRNRQSPGAGTAPCMVLYIVWLVCGKNEWKMWLLYIPLHGAVCHVTLWNQWIENVLTSAFYISLLKSMLAATSFSGLTMSRWIP